MAKTMAAFYELPPWFERMNQLQRQMDLLTQPLLKLQTDYTALGKTITAALDSPVIRDLNKISNVFDSQSIAVIYRTQEIVAKIDTSGIAAALRQYQTVLDSIAPMDLHIQLSDRLQEWPHITAKVTRQIKPLTEARAAELTHLTSLAEEYATTDIALEPGVLSEDEQKLVADKVEDILLSEEGWEIRFAEQIKKFSQTHPVIAWVLEKIFLAILIGVAVNIASSAIGQVLSPTKVYEKPCSSSQVVYRIEMNQNVIITGEVPYYYEVMVNDESVKSCYTGYVSKRSVCVTEDADTATNIDVEYISSPSRSHLSPSPAP